MSLDTNLQSSLTRIGTEFKTLRILVSGSGTGDVSGLDTTATNLVDAINEVLAAAEAATIPDASETEKGKVELATTTETVTGTDTVRAVTPAGVAAAIAALVDAAPGALDTLNELAAALADDPNFATTMTTALAGKQDLDATLTALAGIVTAADKLIYATGVDTFATADLTAAGRALMAGVDAAAQRTTLSVWSKAEIGAVTTDYVAVFEAALT